MVQQMSFEWPAGVALGAEDFFVSDANAQAYDMLQSPEHWPERKLVIAGPPGAGKSHLARILQAKTTADLLHAPSLTGTLRSDAQTVIVEDMHALPAAAEEAMFHLHNNVLSGGGRLLMTGRSAPSRWDITLPDLASRLQATTTVQIDQPDDALLQALLMKLFSDRGIAPKPKLVGYLTKRLERTFAAAAEIVARLDQAALESGDKINTKLAKRLLDNDS